MNWRAWGGCHQEVTHVNEWNDQTDSFLPSTSFPPSPSFGAYVSEQDGLVHGVADVPLPRDPGDAGATLVKVGLTVAAFGAGMWALSKLFAPPPPPPTPALGVYPAA
jgi:hypothetical protein